MSDDSQVKIFVVMNNESYVIRLSHSEWENTLKFLMKKKPKQVQQFKDNSVFSNHSVTVIKKFHD